MTRGIWRRSGGHAANPIPEGLSPVRLRVRGDVRTKQVDPPRQIGVREVVALALVLIMIGVSERDDACDDTGPRPLQWRLLRAQEVDHAAVLDSPVGRHVGQ